MRYDKPIYFQSITTGPYDSSTGDYVEDTVAEVEKYASVTDSGTKTIKMIYGELKQGIKTIRIQRPYTEVFDKIRIDNKVYRVDFSRWNRVFVVSEVQ